MTVLNDNKKEICKDWANSEIITYVILVHVYNTYFLLLRNTFEVIKNDKTYE